MNKFAIPLTTRKELETILKDRQILFNIDDSHPNIRYRITEKNRPESPFFFHIISITEKEGINYYKCEYLPSSEAHLNPGQNEPTHLSLIKRLDDWEKLVAEYNKPSPLFDDPITLKYYNDISSKVKILDEDADTAPFDYEQQTLLMSLYDKIKDEVRKGRNDTNSKNAEAIILEIEYAQANISQETKNQSVERFYKIAAMGMKYSYHIAKLIAETWIIGKALSLITGG